MLKIVAIIMPCLAALIYSPVHQQMKRGAFSFPSRVSHVRSEDATLVASYTEKSSSRDSMKEYVFSVSDDSGTSFVEHHFTRSVEGAWSQTDLKLYLNDYLGSTRIDCFVWNPQSKGLLSLTQALLEDPKSGPIEGRGTKPPETPDNSRFELTCAGWKSKDQLLVNLEGTTWAGGQFKYRLVYDLVLKQFRWNE